MSDRDLRPDIQAARDRMSYRPNREIDALADHLWAGEQVALLAGGRYDGTDDGLLALTNRRLLFLYEGWGSRTARTFDLGEISSVRWSSGIMSGELAVYASGDEAVFDKVMKDDGRAMADAVDNAVAGGGPPHAPAPSPAQQWWPQAHAPHPPAPPHPAAARPAPPHPGYAHAHQPPQQAPADPLPHVPSFDLVRILRDRGVLTPDEFLGIVQRL
ncbi:PH domain-containing protein [Streptomonospora sp. PA3]|uniref:PH domain-containing protein n=1 Tax=Streptomonospora sp. PA3 TaxID=2607326 RepID=UPI0016433AA7